jgi:hypothetical protein
LSPISTKLVTDFKRNGGGGSPGHSRFRGTQFGNHKTHKINDTVMRMGVRVTKITGSSSDDWIY